MSSNSNSIVRKIFQGSAWSLIGILVAVLIFSWQEYRNPYDFNIELVDEFNLVEVREEISDLKIIYKNDDIIESKKEIKIVRITLRNDGNTILQSYYDQLEPFGLRFANAKILSAEITTTNSDHLKEKLIKSFAGGESEQHGDLIFEKVIFDKKDIATIKITLLQISEAPLSITALGKLANINELKVNMETQDGSDPTPIKMYSQVGYLALIIILIFFILILNLIEYITKKNKTKKYIKNIVN